MYDELVKRMRKCATEAGACKTCELDSNPSCTDVLMEQAADAIEELAGFVQEAERDRDEYRERLDKANDAVEGLQKALLLMVLQYCTTDDGLLFHSFMSAGEYAFAVLGLENGQQAEPLWEKVEES